MTCLVASLAAFQSEAQEAVLKRQVRNIQEYNLRKKVFEHTGREVYFKGDKVWVRNCSNRANKLQPLYDGPYYVDEVLGHHGSALRLTLDGKEFTVRNVEQVCRYHMVGRFLAQ